MLSIALAMAWEYWRKTVWLTLIFIVSGAAVVVLPFAYVLLYGGTRGIVAFIPLLFAMIGQVVVAMTGIRRERMEFPQELYARPVSTPALVALRMALGVSTAVVMYLGQILLIWAASGVALPLGWIPLLVLMMAAAWTHAVIWSLPGLALLQVIGLYLVLLGGVGFYGRHVHGVVAGFEQAEPDAGYAVVGIEGYTVVALTGLAYAVAVLGVQFDRRGDRLRLARAVAWISDRLYGLQQTGRSFRSAPAAQFWLEWRQQKGRLLPLLNLLVFVVYALLAAGFEDITLVNGLALLWGLAIINVVAFPILIAMVVNTRERGMPQDLVWCTRPVSDNTLLLVRLKVAIASLLASWGVWLAGAIVISGLLYATDRSESLASDLGNFIGGLQLESDLHHSLGLGLGSGLVILNLWTVLGIVGSLHMTGRKWAAALWLVPIVVPLAWTILVRCDVIPDPMAGQVLAAAPWVTGILCVVGTGLVYWVALRKGRITRRLGLTALGIYLAGLYLIHYNGWVWVWLDPDAGALTLRTGLTALYLLPLALGPLAVAWNRHR